MKKDDFKLLLEIFMTFFKIGGFTLGGGFAMLPIIQTEVVDNKKWATDEEMTDYLTLGQSSPGIVGINAATAVGYKVANLKGGIAATLGMITPSIVIILIIAHFFEDFKSLVYIQKAFQGIRAAVVALILTAVMRLYKNSVKDKLQLTIFLFIAFAVIVLNTHPFLIIVGTGIFAVVYNVIKEKRKPWNS